MVSSVSVVGDFQAFKMKLVLLFLGLCLHQIRTNPVDGPMADNPWLQEEGPIEAYGTHDVAAERNKRFRFVGDPDIVGARSIKSPFRFNKRYNCSIGK